MTVLRKVLWFLGMLVACNPETPSNERVQPPPLVAQRVTATVKREAAWLVHVRTEREALVTTPEHPFATPHSGWIPAGRLVPGDRVVSARFGTVRVVSIQHAKRSRPRAVFNLTVEPSHAYVVGTDQVLVHNKKCIDLAETERELEDAERELEKLNQKLATSESAEEKATLTQEIAAANARIQTLKTRVYNARAYQKRKAGEPSGRKGPAEREKDIEDAEGELEKLNQKLATSESAEEKATLTQAIAAAKTRIRLLKNRVYNARVYQKRKAGPAAEPRSVTRHLPRRAPNRPEPEAAPDPGARRAAGIARTTEAIEALGLVIEGIEKGATTGSTQRLAKLKRELIRLNRVLRNQRFKDRKRRGIASTPFRERLLKRAEAEYESRRQELEAAQRERSELLGEEPQSEAEERSKAERTAALEKKIEILQLEHDESRAILAGERRIAELAGRSPRTDVEREKIEQERRDLTARISKKRKERRYRERHRKLRSDPEAWAQKVRDIREVRKRLRDRLELLQGELAARRDEAGPESLEDRTEYLTERIATLEAILELDRERNNLRSALGKTRARREKLNGAGQDTTEIDRKIARLEQERSMAKTGLVQLRLREAVLARLDATTSTDALDEIDEARLLELEGELEGELAAGGSLPEERLREIVDELGETELIDAEFLDEIWREAEAEEAALQETVQDEAEDEDAVLRALAESLEESPSPERTAAVESDLQALQRELREERSNVEAADFQLANEQAFLSQTAGGPGPSHHAAGAQRLAEVQQQRVQLRLEWRARMQRRLDAARRELRTMQSLERLRDATIEAELARKIALLEHEVNTPFF